MYQSTYVYIMLHMLNIVAAKLYDQHIHFSALRSLTQPCLTAYCVLHITYDPGISPGSANQCILGDVYLRSNLSGNQHIHACNATNTTQPIKLLQISATSNTKPRLSLDILNCILHGLSQILAA